MTMRPDGSTRESEPLMAATRSEAAIGAQVLSALRDRFSSPVMGTFLLFLVVWHWPLVEAYAFSLDTLNLVHGGTDYSLDREGYSWFSRSFAAALSTVAYFLAYPWIQNVVDVYRLSIEYYRERWATRMEEKRAILDAQKGRSRKLAVETARSRELEDSISRVEADLEEKNARHQKVTSKLRELSVAMAEGESELTSVQRKIDATSARLAEGESELVSLESAVRKQVSERDRLHKEKERLDSEVASTWEEMARSGVGSRGAPMDLFSFVSKHAGNIMRVDKILRMTGGNREELARQLERLGATPTVTSGGAQAWRLPTTDELRRIWAGRVVDGES